VAIAIRLYADIVADGQFDILDSESEDVEMMNKVAETLAKWFGSLPFIIFHFVWFTVWIALHVTIDFDDQWSNLTLIVSLEAIFLALFILRAENVQSARTDRLLKHTLEQEKKELEQLQRVKKRKS
jgi:uncharacterized membrane protein